MPRHPAAVREELLSETRSKLLAAAVSEFAQKGFAGANINWISLNAGYAKGTIYNYFASKRALVLALIQETAAIHTQYIAAEVEKEQEPLARLESFFKAGYAFITQQPERTQIAISAVFGHDAEYKEMVFQSYLPLFDLITNDIIEASMAQGKVRPIINADMTTALLMSLYLGSCTLTDEDGNVGFEPAQVVAFVMQGLQPPANSNSTQASHGA